jgi:hypothetical protein
MKNVLIELDNKEYQRLNNLKLANHLTWREMLIKGCPQEKEVM